MSREIKFRSWCEFLGVFAYFENGEYWYDHDGKHFDNGVNAFDWNNAEQFTGLKDKNGIETYRSDIARVFLANTIYSREVFQSESGAWCVNIPVIGSTDEEGVPIILYGCDFEIIGNIHENPELLEKRHEQ